MKTFYCIACRAERRGMRFTCYRTTATVHYVCGHQGVHKLEELDLHGDPLPPETPMTHSGKKTTCFCGDDFVAYGDAPSSQFCWNCRRDLDLNIQAKAEALIKELESIEPSKWAEHMEDLIRKAPTSGPPRVGQRAAQPPADPHKVAAAIRMVTDYGTVEGIDPPSEQPVEYRIAANGLFKVVNTPVARIVMPATTVLGITTPLKAGVELTIPKIPFTILSQTVAFFRAVCVKMHGSCEAFLQIWWDRETKTFVVHVPDQRASGGSVSHQSDFDRDASGRYLYVMDVHSHGSTMSAFWSGTDDADEKRQPEGRMFGVIGNVERIMPSWKWRMRASTSTGFMDLGLGEVFDLTQTDAIPFVVTMESVVAALEKATPDDNGRISLACPVDIFKDATYPAEWLARVNASGYAGGVHGSFRHVGGSHMGGHHHHVPSTVVEGAIIYVAQGDNLVEYRIENNKHVPTGRVVHKQSRVH